MTAKLASKRLRLMVHGTLPGLMPSTPSPPCSPPHAAGGEAKDPDLGRDIQLVCEDGKDLDGKPLNLKNKREEGEEGPNLQGARLEGADLNGAHLEGANLREAHLEATNLCGAHLEGANLQGAHLEGANLYDAHLEGALLYTTHLEGVNLCDAGLEGAHICNAHLEGANLDGAHLEGANLYDAHLGPLARDIKNAEGLDYIAAWAPKGQTACLANAHLGPLKQTDVKNAFGNLVPTGQPTNLSGADLTKVDFGNASFSGAVLFSGAIFSAFTPPKPRASGRDAPWRMRAVGGKVVGALVTRAWYHAMPTEEDDDDGSDAEEDDDGSGADDDEQGASTAAALASRLQALSAVMASVLMHLNQEATELLDKSFDVTSDAVLISGPQLLAVTQAGGRFELVSLETFIEKHLVAPVFDTLLPQLLHELALRVGLRTVGGRQRIMLTVSPAQVARTTDIEEGNGGSAAAGALGAEPFGDLQQIVGTLSEALLHGLRPAFTAAVMQAIEPIFGLLSAVPSKLTAFDLTVSEAIRAKQKEQNRAKQKSVTASVVFDAAGVAARQLLQLVRKTLEDALQKQVKLALFGGARSVLSSLGQDGRSLSSLAKRLDTVQSDTVTCLETLYKQKEADAKKLVAQYVGTGLRAQLLHSALHAATKYEVRIGGIEGSVDMLRLAWRSSRMALTKDENELSYLLEKLIKLEELTVTDQSWKDVGESWQAVLSLRSQISVERGCSVIECICADDKVLQAVGAVEQLRKTQGTVPNDVLTLLNEGPSAHIRGNAYKYRKMIDGELARVHRVKEIQWRVVTGAATGATAALIAAGNVVGRLYYDMIQRDGRIAGMIAAAVVGSLLLCCLGCVLVYWCRAKGSK